MEQVADLSIIKELLDTKTGYKIAKDTDIPQQTISRFQTGTTPIENMKLGVAMKLTEYAKRKKANIS
ncbi:XRE family transcriptional regulator [Aerococcus viridans]|uniref:XRE family transcriptional regulator n=1 Tax=Aerococcus TaxID=1375 RepID=UPI003B216A74